MTCLAESTDPQDVKQAALEILAIQLFSALRDHMEPNHKLPCESCREVLRDARQLFKNLGLEMPQ